MVDGAAQLISSGMFILYVKSTLVRSVMNGDNCRRIYRDCNYTLVAMMALISGILEFEASQRREE
jgi:hypothetical protein